MNYIASTLGISSVCVQSTSSNSARYEVYEPLSKPTLQGRDNDAQKAYVCCRESTSGCILEKFLRRRGKNLKRGTWTDTITAPGVLAAQATTGGACDWAWRRGCISVHNSQACPEESSCSASSLRILPAERKYLTLASCRPFYHPPTHGLVAPLDLLLLPCRLCRSSLYS